MTERLSAFLDALQRFAAAHKEACREKGRKPHPKSGPKKEGDPGTSKHSPGAFACYEPLAALEKAADRLRNATIEDFGDFAEPRKVHARVQELLREYKSALAPVLDQHRPERVTAESFASMDSIQWKPFKGVSAGLEGILASARSLAALPRAKTVPARAAPGDSEADDLEQVAARAEVLFKRQLDTRERLDVRDVAMTLGVPRAWFYERAPLKEARLKWSRVRQVASPHKPR